MRSPVKHRAEASQPAILVLDDDALSLELYARELSSNYRVFVCQHVKEARQYYRGYPLTAVILEPAIDGEDGWLLLREICSSPSHPPVIVCSVLDERKVGFEQGADAFLVKPVLPTTLHLLIDQIVSRRIEKSDR
jgi:DNA-binding response OmpR family regulator